MEAQRRTSKRRKAWALCLCQVRHTSRQACEADISSSRYTGGRTSFSSEDTPFRDGPDASEGSEPEFDLKSASPAPTSSSVNISSSSNSSSNNNPNSRYSLRSSASSDMPESGSKMSAKRPASARKAGKAKKSRLDIDREEQSCDCGDAHSSLLECERENLEWSKEARVQAIMSSKDMVIVTLGGEGRGETKTIAVHRELLMQHSAFFRTLLIEQAKNQEKSIIAEASNGEIKKEEDLKVKIEDAEPAVLNRVSAPAPNALNAEGRLRPYLHINPKGTPINLPETLEGKRAGSAMEDDDLDASMKVASSTKHPKPVSSLSTFGPSTSSSTPAAQPALTTVVIPSIPAIKFSVFIAYIYNSHIPLFLSSDITKANTFTTMYLFATQLGSPGLMNHILTLHRRSLHSNIWPDPEQVQFIYESLGSYAALPLSDHSSSGSSAVPSSNDEMATIAEEGKKVLRRFTAACIAAQNPFERLSEGADGEEWAKLLDECGGLGRDVLKEGKKWAESNPWEECWRREWVVQELELED